MRKKLLSTLLSALAVLVLAKTALAETAAENTYAAQIGDNYYTTFAEAIMNAEGGDRIYLLADCETGEDYTSVNPLILLAPGVTLDLNLHTLTVSNSASFIVDSAGGVLTGGARPEGADPVGAIKRPEGAEGEFYVLIFNGRNNYDVKDMRVYGNIWSGDLENRPIYPQDPAPADPAPVYRDAVTIVIGESAPAPEGGEENPNTGAPVFFGAVIGARAGRA